MTHRDLSITAHIPDDAAERKTYLELRAAFERAFKRNPGGAYPTRLPIELYDRAERQGFNMIGYAYELPKSQTVYISQTLWDRANAIGADLNGFEVQRPIPMGRTHIGTMAAPIKYEGAETGRFAPSDKPKWPCRGNRKHLDDKVCNGKDVTCLPGKDGKCTACDNHD